MREAKRSGRFLVMIPKAKIMYEIQVPKSEIAKSLRLPNLSESCPRIGVAINCIIENEAVKKPRRINPWLMEKPCGSK